MCGNALAKASTSPGGMPSAAPTSHAAGASRGAEVVLPPHVYATYFEAYDSTDGGLAQLSDESGAKYVSLAFLQTAAPGSCTADWNGDGKPGLIVGAEDGFFYYFDRNFIDGK